MAPKEWVDELNDAAKRLSDELQGSSGYKFEVNVGPSEPMLAPWMIAVIALGALVVLVCLVVACCRCCCCWSERGRVIVVGAGVRRSNFGVGRNTKSPTPLMMQQPGAAATHGAGVYSNNNKSSRSQPPAYDQEVLVQLNDTQKYQLLN